ncbi:hypothetical protein ACHAWF_014037 [Thalassiosira exigua]
MGEAGAEAEEDVREKDDATSKTTSAPRQIIGGPGTSLPFFAESFLGWSLCFSCHAFYGYLYGKSLLLSSRWYIRLRRRMRGLARGLTGGWMRDLMSATLGIRNTAQKLDRSHLDVEQEETWIPLTTHSRAELDKLSPWERYLSLVRVLEKYYPDALSPMTSVDGSNEGMTKAGNRVESRQSNTHDAMSLQFAADAALTWVLRQDSVCRRLASLAMRPYNAADFGTNPAAMGSNPGSNKSPQRGMTSLLKQCPHERLLQRISRLWKHLLILPSLDEAKNYYPIPRHTISPTASTFNKNHGRVHHPYRISLVLPAYHENGCHMKTRMAAMLEAAGNPSEVEVIVVDAGGCSNLELLLPTAGEFECDSDKPKSSRGCWGRIAVFPFTCGGGRGPCLNFGASVATGRILTFCHSDTTLPFHWDEKIVATLEHSGVHDGEQSFNHSARANSCAFSFGIDTSCGRLSMTFDSSDAAYYPPGIKAVETAVNIRSSLFSLPYGDQALSFHAIVFEFLGGFPDQCLMEDYELMTLLRKRASSFVPPSVSPGSSLKEEILIIPGTPAVCSPRRWQKFGVLYVTYTNATCVNLYAGSRRMGPDDLFHLYYGRKPPKRSKTDSPWEIKLSKLLEY